MSSRVKYASTDSTTHQTSYRGVPREAMRYGVRKNDTARVAANASQFVAAPRRNEGRGGVEGADTAEASVPGTKAGRLTDRTGGVHRNRGQPPGPRVSVCSTSHSRRASARRRSQYDSSAP